VAALAPYYAEHPYIDMRPSARRPDRAHVAAAGDRRWEATQQLVDETGEADWALFCVVDLATPRDPDVPLISLVRVGT
jgi:hypothetical protein